MHTRLIDNPQNKSTLKDLKKGDWGRAISLSGEEWIVFRSKSDVTILFKDGRPGFDSVMPEYYEKITCTPIDITISIN